MKKKTTVVMISMMVVAVAACSKAETAGGDPAEAGLFGAADARNEDSEKVIARVNGDPIYESDFIAAVANLPQQMQGAVASAAGRKALTEELVRMRLLELEGKRLNVAADPEVAQALRITHGNIIANAALRKLAEADEAGLRKLYEEKKDQFNLIRARQILLAYEGGAIPPKNGSRAASPERVKARADELVRQLRSGVDFGQLAAAESDDPEAQQSGGEIMIRSAMVPADVLRTLDSLQGNQVSDPVRTDIGWHIFQMIGREQRTFEEVKSSLAQQSLNDRLEPMLEELKAKATVEYDESFIGTDAVPVSGAAAPAGGTPPARN
jgi:peptidyl-prolyl cis-trans isomerase C